MFVKICGIKTLEDALGAVDAGADMLGFNFYPLSPRCIAPESCVQIVAALKAMGKAVVNVAVFVDETPRRVEELLAMCGLDLAQFSGDEPLEDLKAFNNLAFKVVRPRSLAEADELLTVYGRPEAAPALLVDAYVAGAYGGTGETGNWAVARHLALKAPILLAGGLNPKNVGAAVEAVRPWGVDVASGVESSPGVKDPSKMMAFISAAKSSIKGALR